MEIHHIDLNLTVRGLVARSFDTAFKHGWWDDCITDVPEGQVVHDGDTHTIEVTVDLRAAIAKIPEKLMLIVTEVAEAMECYRDSKHGIIATWYSGGFTDDDGCPHAGTKPEGLLSELADVYIRIGDLVGALGLADDFVQIIEAKLTYNESRPMRHGNKRA